MFPLSRTMRPSDYAELEWERGVVGTVQYLAGPAHPQQHEHRRWEYSMLVRVFQTWNAQQGGSQVPYEVGDFGCGIGLSPAIMLHYGNNVSMYEPWVYGNEEAFQLAACESVKKNSDNAKGTVRMLHRPLCELILEDYGRYDVSLCVSTLEHIGEYQRAFNDLLRTVRPGGLLFLTTDFAEHEEDSYQLNWLRAGRMFTKEIYEGLAKQAVDEGFSLLGASDWIWNSSCVMVNDYGFASLAMVRQ